MKKQIFPLSLLFLLALVWSVSALQAQDFDVVILNGHVIDPETIADVGTCEKPNQPAVGVQSLLVNGELVIENRELITTAGPGRAIRRSTD